jgi:hypothetical protein
MQFVIAILTVATAAYMTSCSLMTAFTIFVGTTFLVPGTLLVPGVPSSFGSIHNVFMAMLVVNVILQLRRGTLTLDALRPTPVTFMLALFVAGAFVIGLVFGDPSIRITVQLFSWIPLVEQFLVFVITLAVIRHTGDPMKVARIIAGFAVVAAIIAVYEKLSHDSYALWWFNHAGQQYTNMAFGLEFRDGHERVRAAADFSLAYGWIAVSALPLVVAVFTRSRRWIWGLVLPGVVGLSILFTYSRSAYGGAVIAIGLLALLSRLDRRVVGVTVLGSLVAFAMLSYSPSVKGTFEGASAQNSSEARLKRLPILLDEVSKRPVLGLGLASASARHGLLSTDAAYLATYADLGVAGVSLFILMLLVVVVAMLPALRAPPGSSQILGAAALAGFIGVLIGAAALDEFSVSTSFRLAFMLAAIGVAVGEPYRLPRARTPVRWLGRAALPALGFLAGVALYSVAPQTASVTATFDALGPGADVVLRADPGFIGQVLTESSCSAMEAAAKGFPDTNVLCADLGHGDGVGELRVRAPTLRLAEGYTEQLLGYALRADRGFFSFITDREPSARETWTRTAPVWMAAIGLALAMMPRLPTRRAVKKAEAWKRSRRREPSIVPL